MGILDDLRLGIRARELGVSVEEYREYLHLNETENVGLRAYKRYLNEYRDRMSLRAYIDQVLRAPKDVPHGVRMAADVAAQYRQTARPEAPQRPAEPVMPQRSAVPAEPVMPPRPAVPAEPTTRRRRGRTNAAAEPAQEASAAAQTPVQPVDSNEPQAYARTAESAAPADGDAPVRRRRRRVSGPETIEQTAEAIVPEDAPACAAAGADEIPAKAETKEAASERQAEPGADEMLRRMQAALLQAQEAIESRRRTDVQPEAKKPALASQPAVKKPEPAPQPAVKKPAPAPQPTVKKPEPAPQPAAKKPAPAPQPAVKKPAPAPQPAAKKPEPAQDKASGKIDDRLQRLLDKLDSTFPDHVVTGLSSQHHQLAERVGEMHKLMGYPDNESFLKAYGYTLIKSVGGRPVKDRAGVIDELKARHPAPVEGSVATLMEANPDLAPRIKTLMNSAQEVFGMRLGDYLVKEGILAEKKKPEPKAQPAPKQTPEQKLETITAQLRKRYPTVYKAPRYFGELKSRNTDLPLSTLNTLTQRVAGKTATQYLIEQGVLCDEATLLNAATAPDARGRRGWGGSFNKTILGRGLDICAGDSVTGLQRTAQGIEARVKGTKPYVVSIRTEGDEVHGMTCSCPYAGDGLNCKHMAAVLFLAGERLYMPKAPEKKAAPVMRRPAAVSCGENEILVLSWDRAAVEEIAAMDLGKKRGNPIVPCGENPAYYLLEIPFDCYEDDLELLMDMIGARLNGRGAALGRCEEEEHEVLDIGFYDGECLWYGDEGRLYPDPSEAADEPEEWVNEPNPVRRRSWAQSKKLWKSLCRQLTDMDSNRIIDFCEQNLRPMMEAEQRRAGGAKELDAGHRCEEGEAVIVSGDRGTIEAFFDEFMFDPTGGVRLCARKPEMWYAAFDMDEEEDPGELLKSLAEESEEGSGKKVILARSHQDEDGNRQIAFYDGSDVWTCTEGREHEACREEIGGGRSDEEAEALWRSICSRIASMTAGDLAQFYAQHVV